MTTNYRQTFIAVSPDSSLPAANTPKPGTVAALQLDHLRKAPYTLTSDDLLFEVEAIRQQIAPADRCERRAAFEQKSKACLRASPLVKTHGWGLHHDAEGHVAAWAIDDPHYAELAEDPSLHVVSGMRSRRK
jgi:hypothetical protein